MAAERQRAAESETRHLDDRYRLFERIAVGGMAEVWRGFDEALQRPVAIKLLKQPLLANPVTVERFHREAVAGARLSHPNIVSVYDTLSLPGIEAIVMEMVEGCSLRQRLDRCGQLDVRDVVSIAQQMLAALSAAHRQGLIHRDIKPANILLADNGRVLLGDFGIAKTDNEIVDLTTDNVMLGTAKYVAPEQVTGANIDARTDLYSLGLVLYECCAGESPFATDDDTTTALARLHRDPTPIGRIRRDLPAGLSGLIDRLLHRDPDLRPGSTAESLSLLTHFEAPGEPPLPRPDPTTSLQLPGAPPRHAANGGRDAAAPSPRPSLPGSRPPRRRAVHVGVGLLLGAAVIVSAVAIGSTRAGLGWLRRTKPTEADAASVPVIGGPLSITSVKAFDPFGDGQERSADLAALTDANPTTAWTTERYRARDMAGKPGVGLVIELASESAVVTISADGQGPDWAATLYRSSSPATQLDGWGPAASRGRAANDQLTLEARGAGRFLLLWITDPGTGTPRFRLGISELHVHG